MGEVVGVVGRRVVAQQRLVDRQRIGRAGLDDRDARPVVKERQDGADRHHGRSRHGERVAFTIGDGVGARYREQIRPESLGVIGVVRIVVHDRAGLRQRSRAGRRVDGDCENNGTARVRAAVAVETDAADDAAAVQLVEVDLVPGRRIDEEGIGTGRVVHGDQVAAGDGAAATVGAAAAAAGGEEAGEREVGGGAGGQRRFIDAQPRRACGAAQASGRPIVFEDHHGADLGGRAGELQLLQGEAADIEIGMGLAGGIQCRAVLDQDAVVVDRGGVDDRLTCLYAGDERTAVDIERDDDPCRIGFGAGQDNADVRDRNLLTWLRQGL